jgi:uncharacterized protein YndB with AHSA1/START domain
VHADVEAPIERVWRVVADHAGWRTWAGVQEVVLRQQGDPPPNGLGAIRVLRRSGLAIEEEIVEFEPPRRMAYRVTAGIPARDCCAELVLEPSNGATRVHWRVRFRPLLPGSGALLRWWIRPRLQSALAGLARSV